MIQLVIDNTARFAEVGNLLRAVHMAAVGEPLPQDMVDLLLNLDLDSIEDDLRLAVALTK